MIMTNYNHDKVHQRTSIVPVVLSASTAAITTILSVRGPVGHAAQLVVLGKGSVGNAIEHGLGGDCWSPSVTLGQPLDELNEVIHDVVVCIILLN